MNKTIIININGIVFHIEEDAYDALRSYMIDVKKHFGHSADSHEIVGDIENRIAEMFNEKIVAGRKEVITMADVQEVIEQMGRVSDFSDAEQTNSNFDTEYMDEPERVQRKLMRDPEDRILGGVCSGLGHYFGIEARWVRLIFVLLFLTAGSGLLIYLILWIIIPVAKTRADRMAMRGEAPNIRNFKRSFQEEMEGLRSNFTGAGGSVGNALNSAAQVVGKILIVFIKIIGIFFIAGLCAGLIVLLVSIFATFGFLGMNNDMAMFPMNVIDPEIRNILLVSGLMIAIIPLVGLIGLTIHILFNRRVIGRYTGFSLLAVWLLAVGLTTVYSVRTANDFREESTVIEEKTLETFPAYYLSKDDLTVIKLQDSLLSNDRLSDIRRNALERNSTLFDNQRRVYIRINQVDSLIQPSITYHYQARGANYEDAAERAGKIRHHFIQNGPNIEIDSHFTLEMKELMRDQGLTIQLNLPVGTRLFINEDLRRHIRSLPLSQCEQNYESRDGFHPKQTEWVMTPGGLKCSVEAPIMEVPEEEIQLEETPAGEFPAREATFEQDGF